MVVVKPDRDQRGHDDDDNRDRRHAEQKASPQTTARGEARLRPRDHGLKTRFDGNDNGSPIARQTDFGLYVAG